VAFSLTAAFRGFVAAWRDSWLRGDSRLNVPPMAVHFAGLQLTRTDALMLSAVWACMEQIAKNLAAAPTNIYEPIEGTKRRRKIEKDNRAWLLNVRPNEEMTAIAFRESLLLQALADGNSYAEIGRDRGGRVAALYPLLSDRVTPRRNESKELVYDVRDELGDVRTLASRDVFHLRGPSVTGLMGDNVVARASRSLAVAAAHERFSAAFYGRGAQLGGVAEFPGKLAEDQKAALRESWENNHAGLGKAHRLLVLEGGAKFTATTVDPQKASLVDDKKFSVEEIARWFGVPLHKIQHLEHATFSNIEHQGLDFVNGCLFPWAVRYCQELNAKVFNTGAKGPWWYAEIDLSHLVRGDALTRANAASAWVQNGVKTRNEVRAEEGLDDVGDAGDTLTVQLNMTTLPRLMADAAAPAPAPQQVAARALTLAALAGCARCTKRALARADAIAVLVEEMADFDELTRSVLGSSFTREIAEKCLDAYAGGSPIEFVSRPTPPRLGAAA